jgi:hypothetical protein
MNSQMAWRAFPAAVLPVQASPLTVALCPLVPPGAVQISEA